MNIRQYIDSGIVESYTLGLATAEEVAEFEKILPFYPELQGALAEFEFQLENFAMKAQEPPPPEIREKVLDFLREKPAIRREFRQDSNGSAPHVPPNEDYLHVSASSSAIWGHKTWRNLFIIVFILSKIFLGFAIYYFIMYRNTQKEIKALEQRVEKSAPLTPAGKN